MHSAVLDGKCGKRIGVGWAGQVKEGFLLLGSMRILRLNSLKFQYGFSI